MTKVPHFELGHVGIYVEDMDRMIAFYERVMGYSVSDRGKPPLGGYGMHESDSVDMAFVTHWSDLGWRVGWRRLGEGTFGLRRVGHGFSSGS